MALPIVKTLGDCGDFTKTVLPYLPQLGSLPQTLLKSSWTLNELRNIYVETNPLISGLALSLLLAPIFLVISEINKNYSQVDRVWSILPTIYIGHFTAYAHLTGLPTQRLDTLTAASAVWSLRLTYNYWRKGGYNIGSEDYRWELLRQRISPPLFFLFNVTFISLAQSLLLYSIATPAYVILLASNLTPTEATTEDLIFTRVIVGLVLVEFFADQQQWAFQTAKKEYQKSAKAPFGYEAEDLDRGFVVTGLWSWSRHPNFAAEQAIWALVYQYSCYTTDSYLNWTLGGAFSYLILFQGSTWFTELVSASKYPEYVEYQQRVGKFLPRLSTDAPTDASERLRAERREGAKDK
ncbi:MAG: hypothetical protein M1832_003190 [Thelocarpon impressellum]|nr:MAG: hypothetical protein M1832_003190 [Thelocarpon impressellum]